ncbi:MAG: GTP 3',8-cyclase MoaA [Thermoanaerobaculia bacterium]|nr:MAG: GTP 3',8-cyclase MoaA [Thermoanaerobaculia bacterium]
MSAGTPPPFDRLGRPLADLRISVTDRCNFRCTYCMPREAFGSSYRFLPRSEILTFEEIVRVAVIFERLGARKIRLTGGEPLLRHDLPGLVRRLAAATRLDLALTTNGSLLAEQAAALAAAGLARISISLDSLDDETFRRLNDVRFPVARVLEGIAAAEAAGLVPVKLNAVIRKGVNEDSIVPLVERFRGTGHVVRFIEYMDVGATNRWRLDDVVPAGEILERLRARFELQPLEPAYRGEVARRWRLADGSGEVGLIASVTAPFCGDCTRARLSAEGRLYTCLFAAAGHDLRGPLRSGADDEQLEQIVRAAWAVREDRYSELRAGLTSRPARIEMSYIGG